MSGLFVFLDSFGLRTENLFLLRTCFSVFLLPEYLKNRIVALNLRTQLQLLCQDYKQHESEQE